jgi:hypothetical protein
MREIDFEERRENLDEQCEIVRSNLCYWMSGRVGCGQCYVHMLKGREKREEARDKWEDTLALFPADIDSIHETDECQFCKGEKKKADGYAFIEMANPEPYYEKGMFFGIGKKIRTPVGSLISLQASVCPSCRRKIKMLDYIMVLSIVVFLAVAIVLLMFPQIANPMGNLFVLLPVIFIGLMGLAGYMMGKFLQSYAMRKAAEMVKTDYSDIPVIAKLLARNWFFFQVTNGLPRVSFSKHKMYDHVRKPEPKVELEDDDFMTLDNMNI